MWINMVRAVTTRSRSRQPEIDKETEKPQPKETSSNNDTTRNDSPDNPRDTSIREMQSTDPFCRRIMKRLINKTAPEHELKTFFIHNGLLYRYASDHSKDFCALVIPKSWKYTRSRITRTRLYQIIAYFEGHLPHQKSLH